jgi:hypothetical protein
MTPARLLLGIGAAARAGATALGAAPPPAAAID